MQSFFISIKNKVFINKIFCDFLLSVKKEIDKSYVVRKYEIGMSLLFKESDYTVSYFLDSSLIKNPANHNLPLYYPHILISKYKFPFLKIESFRHPYISNIHDTYYKKIAKIICDSYNIKLIKNHLIRILFYDNNKVFMKLTKFNKYFINKRILTFLGAYNPISGKYQILINIMNFIKITINIPNKYSYMTVAQFKKYLFDD